MIRWLSLVSIALICLGCGQKAPSKSPPLPPASVMPPAAAVPTNTWPHWISASKSETGAVAFLGGDKKIRVFDGLSARRPIQATTMRSVDQVALSPDGKWIAVSEVDGSDQADIYVFREGRERHLFKGPNDFSMCFYTENDVLLATSWGALFKWDLKSGKKLLDKAILDRVNDWMEIVPGSNLKLVFAQRLGDDGDTQVFSTSTFKAVGSSTPGDIDDDQVVMEDGKIIILRHNESGIHKIDLADGRELGLIPGADQIYGVSSDGTVFWTRHPEKRSATFYRTKTLAPISTITSSLVIYDASRMLGNNVLFIPGPSARFFDIETGKLALKVLPVLETEKEKGAQEEPWIAILPNGAYFGSSCDAYAKVKIPGAVKDRSAVERVWKRLFPGGK